MRIEASQVSYVAAHRSVDATTVIDETLVRPGTPDPEVVAAASTATAQPTPMDTVQLSGLAGLSGSDLEDLRNLTPTQRMALLAIETLVGHKIKLLHLSLRPAGSTATTSAPAGSGAASVHRLTELHAESEQMSFQAQGVVSTTDGRSIQFSVELTMQRQFQSASTTVSSKAADPLVVNFGGRPAQLTGAKIAFDLNSDGKKESVSFVAGGSGFLVLDSNGDGKVNDGQELFGPKTGNGFAELASYDADQNGWIDGNDPVFSQLRIWTKDGLSTLSEKGLGAISTASVETPFALKDGANVLQGNVRGTGVYLSQNGTAGTIQQLDLAEG
jgi:hypothetical protein